MSLFTIGDPHLSFGTDKPMDIFRGWSDYTTRLEKTWKSIVTDGDTVVIPGDISWAMSLENAKADFDFLERLPGTKIILKGNHDYWWETMHKMSVFLEKNNFRTIRILFNNAYRVGDYAIAGTRGWFFDDDTPDASKILNREAGRLRMSLQQARELGGEILVFLHYPPVMDDKVCNEIYQVLLDFDIRYCFFGHLHGPGIGKYGCFERDSIRFQLVSADFLSFCPKLLYY